MGQFVDPSGFRPSAALAGHIARAGALAGRVLRHCHLAPVVAELLQLLPHHAVTDGAGVFARAALGTGRFLGHRHLAQRMRQLLNGLADEVFACRAHTLLLAFRRTGRLLGHRPFFHGMRQLAGIALLPVVALRAVFEIKALLPAGGLALGLPRAVAVRVIRRAGRQRGGSQQHQHKRQQAGRYRLSVHIKFSSRCSARMRPHPRDCLSYRVILSYLRAFLNRNLNFSPPIHHLALSPSANADTMKPS